GSGDGVAQGDDFQQHGDHLLAVAYRMLGGWSDAEDAVQEAWLRYATACPAELADVRGWLTTVTARICLDVLRSARVRRGGCVGAGVPPAGGGPPSPPRRPSARPPRPRP